MTKIKLPREITEAIEDLRDEGCNDARIVYKVETGKCTRTLNDYFYSVGTPDELMQALVNGYEVEVTPEDKVRNYYESVDRQYGTSNGSSIRRIITKTLDLLDIKIEGVNA